MLNKLVPIPVNDLPKLRDLYLKDWPKNYTGYHTIDNYYRWFNQDSTLQTSIQVYSLNGDWNDGTFMILDNYKILLINTCNEDHSKISQLLSLIDWNNEWDIFGFTNEIRQDIDDFLKSKNLKFRRYTEAFWYYLSKEDAMKIDISIPEGFMLKPLADNDVKTINSLWPFSKDGTENFIKRLIKFNPSFGIFNDNQEIVGWIMRSQIGTLAILHVMDEYKRRGFGTLLIKILSKYLAEKMKHDSCATIVTNNTPSINLFNKCGFKSLNKVYWAENVTLKK